MFHKLTCKLPLAFLLLALSCGKASEDVKPEPNNSNQNPGVDLTPGGTDPKPGDTTPVPVKPMQVKALKERSTEEYCAGLTEFAQNYAATKLSGTSLAFLKVDGTTCSIDSSALNINLRSTLIFTKGQSSLRLAINFYAPYTGDTFGATTLLLDRLTNKSETFVPQSSDAVFGDLSVFKANLQAHVELKGSTFKLYGVNRSAAYKAVEKTFANGNQRVFQASPRIRLALVGGTVKMLEVDPANFRKDGLPATFLRCGDASCLASGLTYEFQGLDLVLYAKPYIGAQNQTIKAPTRFRIAADWFKN